MRKQYIKKYRVSRFYAGVYICGFIILACGVPVGIFAEGKLYLRIFFSGISTLGIFALLYQVLYDFMFAQFSLDATGITMYMGFKTYPMKWENCKSFGVVDVRVEQGSSTFWIYCAQRPLTDVEKRKFLSKTRKDLNLVHYFQYSEEPFEEMLKYIPEGQAKYLRSQIATIRMNPIEKLYHKK